MHSTLRRNRPILGPMPGRENGDVRTRFDVSELVCGYLPLVELARGGMGVTQLATRRSGQLCQLVVVKRPHAEILRDQSARRRFFHESLVATSLNHPSLVRTLVSGEDRTGPFIVLEYVHGVTLGDLVDRAALRGRSVAWDCVVRVGLSCLSGLDALHHAQSSGGQRLNVVHRDVCPSNILLSTAGAVKLNDFGVAKSQLSTVSTEAQYLLGKLPFLAPEYLLTHQSDATLDIYSLGISLWYALAGRLPHEACSPGDLVAAIVSQPVPSLRGRRKDVPRALDDLLGRMCAKDPEQRPLAAEALLAFQSLFVETQSNSQAGDPLVREAVLMFAGKDLEQRWERLQGWAHALHGVGIEELPHGN